VDRIAIEQAPPVGGAFSFSAPGGGNRRPSAHSRSSRAPTASV